MDETPIALPPTLARLIGITDAIILQHLQYLAAEGRGLEEDEQGAWVHKTISQWRMLLPSIGRATCFRTLRRLVDDGYLSKRQIGELEAYAINHAKVDGIMPPEMRAMAASSLLFPERPLFFLPRLAALPLRTTARKAIGEAGALVLQQLHYSLGNTRQYRDGRPWVTRSYEEWEARLRFVQLDHMRRIFYSLRDAGLMLVEASQTENRYSIDYALMSKLEAKGVGKMERGQSQNAQVQVSALQPNALTPQSQFAHPPVSKRSGAYKELETIQDKNITAAMPAEPGQPASDAAAVDFSDGVDERTRLLIGAGVDPLVASRLIAEKSPEMATVHWLIARTDDLARRGQIRQTRAGWMVMAIRRGDRPDASPLFESGPQPTIAQTAAEKFRQATEARDRERRSE